MLNKRLTFTRQLRLLSYLAFIVGGFFLVFKLYFQGSSDETPVDTNHIPSLIVSGVKGQMYDVQGQIQYRLFADSALLYPDEDHTIFVNPNAYFYSSTKEVWEVRAKNGEATNYYETIHLWDTVKVFRTAPGKQGNLFTDSLFFYPKTQILQTDDFTTMMENGLTVTSKGFYADIKQGKLILEKQAEVQYAGNL
jgi:LPS export ABC transporter protein LptC